MSKRFLRMVPRLNFKMGELSFKGNVGLGTSVNVVVSKGGKKLGALIFDAPEILNGQLMMNYQVGPNKSGADSVNINDVDVNDEKQLISFIEGVLLGLQAAGVWKENA